MTAQIMDRCHFEGHSWHVLEWRGDDSPVPTPKALGFATRMAHTANWRGYTCEYRIDGDGWLWLVRMDAFPAAGYETFTPHRAQRTAPADNFTGEVGYVFAAYPVPFTGVLWLGRDLDESVRFPEMEPAQAFRHQALLRLRDGHLERTDYEQREPPADDDNETLL